jgi:hypothetical protein
MCWVPPCEPRGNPFRMVIARPPCERPGGWAKPCRVFPGIDVRGGSSPRSEGQRPTSAKKPPRLIVWVFSRMRNSKPPGQPGFAAQHSRYTIDFIRFIKETKHSKANAGSRTEEYRREPTGPHPISLSIQSRFGNYIGTVADMSFQRSKSARTRKAPCVCPQKAQTEPAQ